MRWPLQRHTAALAAAALAFLAALAWVYANGLGHELIFDDARFKDAIRLGIDSYSLQPAFRSLSTASFYWVYDALGPDWRWQRMVNIGLHLANAVVLWCLTVRLLQRAEPAADSASLPRLRWAALAGVAVWAFNPVGAYAVTYLVQRSTLMATFFAVCVLLAFIEALRSTTWSKRCVWLAATAACYGLTLMSKEHAAPVVALLLPLYVYWAQPSGRALLRVSLPLGAIAVICAGWLIGVKGWKLGAVAEDAVKPFLAELEALLPGATGRVYALSVVNQLWRFFHYGALWALPWPGWLSIDLRPAFPLSLWEFPHALGVLGYVVLLAAGVWALLRMRGAWRLVSLLMLIPAALYVTELAYVRLQEPFVLYRSYLWSIAWPVLIALVIRTLLDDARWVAVATGVACGVLALGLMDRVDSLRNSLSVWRDAAQKIPVQDRDERKIGDWRPHFNYATYLFQWRNYADAYRHIQYAKEMGLADLDYRVNAGAILVGGGRPDLAAQVLAPLMGQPKVPFTAFFNLAAAYKFIGQPKLAIEAFDKGLQNPRVPTSERAAVLLDAGMVALSMKDWARAEDYFRQHLAIRPDTPEAIVGVANAMYETGRRDAALTWLSESIEKTPSAELFHARAYVHFKGGDRAKARADNDRSLALKPGHPPFLAMRQAIDRGH